MELVKQTVKFSKEENAKIKEIKNKHTDLQNYCKEIFGYLNTLGLNFQINSIPLKPGNYIKGNSVYNGWKGTIDIKCTSHKELSVSEVLWNNWHPVPSNEKIFEVETCTGGGGNPISYKSGFIILFKTLPKLKYYLLKEGVTAKLNYDFQIAVQDEIKQEQYKYNDNIRKNITQDIAYSRIKYEIYNIENKLKDLKIELNNRKMILQQQTRSKTPMVLTDISDVSNTILDKNIYNTVSNYTTKKQNSDVYKIAQKAHKFVQEHPELMII